MANIFDTRKSCTPFNQNSTLIAVIELSQGSWLAGGIVPGLERSPAKKLNAKEKREEELLKLLISSMVYGPVAAFLAEFFPARVRYISVSLTYHVANGWLGGIMPVVAASIITATGDIYAGLWYVMAGAALSFVIGSLFLHDPQHRPIHL